MADAMQGIMSLPPEMGGMETAPQGFLTPEDENTLNQLRSSVSAKDFGSEMLNAAEQADPQSVMQLRMMLQGLQLPPEFIDLLQQMVDKLLAEPDNYQENRQKFIEEGVPEDLLPPDFDPNFFAALNMALDQVSGPPVQGFAAGGMAMNPIAGGIAGLGRYGDTMLAHITPQEARMLRQQGGAGSINPATGLPEFFNLFKSVGNAFKSVGRAVVGAVKGIGSAIKSFVKSDIGRMITTVAIAYFLGPAAASMLGATSTVGVAAISGFVGSAGSTLLSGGSFKDALKAGAIGGVTSGIGAGVMGGSQAFQAGSYGGPTTVGGQYRNFAQTLSDKTGVGLPGSQPQTDLTRPSPYDVGMVTPEAAAMPPTSPLTEQAGIGQLGSMQGPMPPVSAPPPVSAEMGAVASPPSLQLGTPPPSAGMTGESLRAAQNVASGQGPISVGQYQGPTSVTPPPPVDVGTSYGFKAPGAGPRLDAMATSASSAGAAPPPSQGIMDLIGKGEFTQAGKQALQGTKDIYNQYLSPSGIQEAGSGAAQTKALEAVNALPAGTSEGVKSAVYTKVYEANLPGMVSTYGPLAAAGMGAAYLMGGFEPQPTPKPNIPTSGAELYKRNPYLLEPKINTISASTGAAYGYATGGIADLAGGTSKYPRKNGPIDGPGTGTSDSIPAMLSDGEFVFTAKAVRAMGKGSRRKGAKRMYALMKALEKRT